MNCTFDSLFQEGGLSLERLRNFVAVVDAGSLAKAAARDPNRQSLFSRQLKELEGFFGVALTRRVGRRIEITAEGHQLAALVRRQLFELEAFRQAGRGRPVTLRIGGAASLLEWVVIPAQEDLRELCGDVAFVFEQARSIEVVAGVSDGKLDLGVVREDALDPAAPRRVLGPIEYRVFVPKRMKAQSVAEAFERAPFGEIDGDGRFARHYRELLSARGWTPQVMARAGSFVHLARMVQAGQVAAILPKFAGRDLSRSARSLRFSTDDKRHLGGERRVALIWNNRGLERARLNPAIIGSIAGVLNWEGES